MNESESPLLISLRPRYADLIFDGLKKAELRRRDLSRMKGRDVFVYVTSPEMKLRGEFRVGEVLTGTPEEIWDKVSDYAGVDKPDFDAYYAGREFACALKIAEFWEYKHPIELEALRERFPGFVVPQSWRYVRPEEHESFRSIVKKRGRVDADIVAPLVQTPHVQSPPLLQPAAA